MTEASRKARNKRQNFNFLLLNKSVMKSMLFLIIMSIVIVVSFFFLVFFSQITKTQDLFFIEIKQFLITNFWVPFIFFMLWGFLVIRVSYNIAVNKLSAPFYRFQDHMEEIAKRKEKDFFIHRNSDHHMKDMVASFNKMIDNLFDEIENRQMVIKKLRNFIKKIYQNNKSIEQISLEEALDLKEFENEDD